MARPIALSDEHLDFLDMDEMLATEPGYFGSFLKKVNFSDDEELPEEDEEDIKDLVSEMLGG